MQFNTKVNAGKNTGIKIVNFYFYVLLRLYLLTKKLLKSKHHIEKSPVMNISCLLSILVVIIL